MGRGWPRGVSREEFKRRKLIANEPKDTTMAEQTPEPANTELLRENAEVAPVEEAQEAVKSTMEVEKSFLKGLMDTMHAMELRLEEAEKNAKKKGGIETAAMRLSNKLMAKEPDPLKVQESIEVVDVPTEMNAEMLHNCCPFCLKFHKGKPTILDKSDKSGKFACRRCGKHWYPWALVASETSGDKYPYTLALEQGDKQKVERMERIQMAKAGMPVNLLDNEEE